MKKSFVSAMISIVLLPLAALGQSTNNIVSFSLFGPTMKVVVLNNTTDNTPMLAVIGEATSPSVLQQGERWGKGFGFSNMGTIPVLLQMCQDTQISFHFASAPEWAQNNERFGELAITDDYLRTNPSEPALKQRVKELKVSIHNDLGKKNMEAEINEWFRVVKTGGIDTKRQNCGLPKTLTALVLDWGQWSYYGQYSTTMVIVTGSKAAGYHFEYPRYMYTIGY